MRIYKDILEAQGKRLSPHSKFYMWNDMLFEPAYRGGRRTKTYKAINDKWRIRDIIRMHEFKNNIPKVSETIGREYKLNLPNKLGEKREVENRFDILDIK